MAWDTERTRRLLLDAAIEEFAAHGLHGARVAAVAERAGVNKERIYQYFGNKDGLFAAVRDVELARLPDTVELTDAMARDLGEYAGRLFDYHAAHPRLLRLLYWEGLEAPDLHHPLPSEAARGESYARRVEVIRRAQDGGHLAADLDPHRLLYAVIALASWWFAAPQVVRLILGDAADDRVEQRAALVQMARRMCRPGGQDTAIGQATRRSSA